MGASLERIERHVPGGTLTWEVAGEPPVLRLTVVGDVDGDTVLDAQQEVVARGWYRLGLPSLFDIRTFTGNMPWGQIRRLNEIRQAQTPSEQTRVAIITHDRMFTAFSRLIDATTPRLKVRFYPTLEEGLDWVHPGRRRG